MSANTSDKSAICVIPVDPKDGSSRTFVSVRIGAIEVWLDVENARILADSLHHAATHAEQQMKMMTVLESALQKSLQH